MKVFAALLLTIFLFTGFTNPPEKEYPPFKIEIAYKDLPNPMTTEYSIDNKKMTLNNVLYDNKEASYQSVNKSTYKNFDREKLISFLKQTDWGSISSQFGTPTPDGYHYVVKIEINNQTYNFDIQNFYHPTFASLFKLCNDAIPDKEKRAKYHLPYN